MTQAPSPSLTSSENSSQNFQLPVLNPVSSAQSPTSVLSPPIPLPRSFPHLLPTPQPIPRPPYRRLGLLPRPRPQPSSFHPFTNIHVTYPPLHTHHSNASRPLPPSRSDHRKGYQQFHLPIPSLLSPPFSGPSRSPQEPNAIPAMRTGNLESNTNGTVNPPISEVPSVNSRGLSSRKWLGFSAGTAEELVNWNFWLNCANLSHFIGRLISPAMGRAGGLWLLWNADTIKVHSASVFSRMITAEVSATDPEAEDFLLTRLYNFPTPSQQNQVWEVISYPKLIQSEFYYHFQNLYSSNSASSLDTSLDPLISCLNETHLYILNSPISKAEIKAATFTIGSFKAAGLDVFSSGFFKHFWSNIKNELIPTILSFFSNAVLLPEINETTIVLIPKNSHPSKSPTLHLHLVPGFGKSSLDSHVNNIPQQLQHLKLVDVIDHNQKTWNLSVVVNILSPLLQDRIQSIPISTFLTHDRLYWGPSSSDEFTVKGILQWMESTTHQHHSFPS
ncbi:hypothetical protein COLO4_29216 [Corchorus olitorius]|uniref:Uncharacterized protein n=1 Tax=Corchorus olitorius TaxID=93759 RepID=A0A1R3HFU1_9ROSI|nr:hypothetical protein COLO4_29216 [Corchorus olitorius]